MFTWQRICRSITCAKYHHPTWCIHICNYKVIDVILNPWTINSVHLVCMRNLFITWSVHLQGLFTHFCLSDRKLEFLYYFLHKKKLSTMWSLIYKSRQTHRLVVSGQFMISVSIQKYRAVYMNGLCYHIFWSIKLRQEWSLLKKRTKESFSSLLDNSSTRFFPTFPAFTIF